jgi:uncharacterized protein YhjY with autotransporter beta-barrel domain
MYSRMTKWSRGAVAGAALLLLSTPVFGGYFNVMGDVLTTGAVYTFSTDTAVDVFGITSDVNPAPGRSGLAVFGIGGANIAMTFYGVDYYYELTDLITTSSGAPALQVTASGTDGELAVGSGDGNAGGAAGNASMAVYMSGENTDGNNAPGLQVKSVGGNGSAGGNSANVTDTDADAGGNGGDGGDGGGALVVNHTPITIGAPVPGIHPLLPPVGNSPGILAQSKGGTGAKGGNGGSVTGTGIGGSGGFGGKGGNAGSVTVTNHGAIYVAGMPNSPGIAASSLGGAGGVGGAGGGSTVQSGLGGQGGQGGNAGDVSIKNSGNINTVGASSYGLYGVANGGVGGAGGAGAGVGGDGGNGGFVTAANDNATLSTLGDNASGIFVQAAGGTGGAGAASGNGGNGGLGGEVYASNGSVIDELLVTTTVVTPTSFITTYGSYADGITAASLGGMGGAGGDNSYFAGNGGAGGDAFMAAAYNAASGQIETKGVASAGLRVSSLGGAGGVGGECTAMFYGTNGAGGLGGNAGLVSAGNYGTIITRSNASYGISAQSIGGTGGDGGMHRTLDGGTITTNDLLGIASAFTNFAGVISASGLLTNGTLAGLLTNVTGGGNVAGSLGTLDQATLEELMVILAAGNSILGVIPDLGANGGNGGNGGDVDVVNSGAITTEGLGAYGILAISRGGDGGNAVYGATANGGNGGDGGIVTVLNEGTISTLGDYAGGIFAGSFGGNGPGNTNYYAGGNGGVGGTVTVGNNGRIQTLGSTAHAIEAVSQGGYGQNAGARLSSAGTGGNGGAGSDVTVNSGVNGEIETFGVNSYGINAHSSGGNGGLGGSDGLTTNELIAMVRGLTNTDWAAFVATNNISVSVDPTLATLFETGSLTGATATVTVNPGALGGIERTIVGAGAGGSGGDGGNININNEGSIITHGIGAIGIYAYSTGGNGNNAGTSLAGLLGGDGGDGGNGGQIAINNTGLIRTYGDYAHGIYAYSTGGDGGFSSSGLILSGVPRASGSAGSVSIENSGLIEAYGNYAYGIYASSIGGAPIPPETNTQFGATGGSGGDVTINTTGSVFTHGSNSVAIYLQSHSGDPAVQAGNLSVNVGAGATIQSVNVDNYGVYFNGGAYNSLVNNGTIIGGGGTSDSVLFNGGINNTLDNYGMIDTSAGVYGSAIRFNGGENTVNNYGTVVGKIMMGGSGPNLFNNINGGRFDCGTKVLLGAGSELNNSGILSPGGRGITLTTSLTGNYVQNADGTLEIEFGGANGYDSIWLPFDTATLDGTLDIGQVGSYVPDVGSSFTILSAEAGVNNTFTTYNDYYTNHYAIYLSPVYTPTSVVLTVMQGSYSDPFVVPESLTHNQQSIADWLDSFSGDPDKDALIDILNGIPGANLPGALNLISPEELGLLVDEGIGAAAVFNGNMQQRMTQLRRNGVGGLSQNVLLFSPNRGFAAAKDQLPATASDVPRAPAPVLRPPKGWGFFTMGNAQVINIDDTSDSVGGDIETSGITLGADAQIRKNLLLGVAFDYVNSDITFANGGFADVTGGKASVFATWFSGDFHVDGAIGGGFNSYDTTRTGLGGNAIGSTDGTEIEGLLGGGYDKQIGRFTLSPGASLYYSSISINGFTEDGSLAPLDIGAQNGSSLQARLGANLAYNAKFRRILLKPQVGIYLQHEFLDAQHSVDARLADGTSSRFTVDDTEVGRDSLPLSIGLSVQFTSRIGMSLAYEQILLRNNSEEYNMTGGLNVGL